MGRNNCSKCENFIVYRDTKFEGNQELAILKDSIDLSGNKFIDSVFKNIDFSHTNLEGACFNDVTFDHCKLHGVDFSKICHFKIETLGCTGT